MGVVISNDVQGMWPDDYASSSQVRLTLRANGEEQAQIITPQNGIVRAGFDAPTVAPTMTNTAGAYNVTGSFYYAYAYASSKYPFVENAVAAGGEIWPRSNPSPASAAVITVTTDKVNVSCAKTTRSDVDWIFVYRTANDLSAADAAVAATAGEFFYVGKVANDGIAGTAVFIDNSAVNTGEIFELDNFTGPTFRFTVFDGTYWWGFGNTEFIEDVSLNGTSIVTLTEAGIEWFTGRDGQVCTLDGISGGGFDGKGSFYFKRLTNTTATLYNEPEFTTALASGASGTTTIRIRAATTTLYRSKIRNPFAWGRTTTQFISDNETTNVSDLWAEKIGGGIGTGLSLIGNERLLKLDCQNPSKCYALNLGDADGEILSTLRILDDVYSTAINSSQFAARISDGQSVITSLDVAGAQILQADGQSQIPSGGNVITALRALDGDYQKYFHGVYDIYTELNCWWVKRLTGTHKIDTMLYQHGPTGKWGMMPDFDITAAATIHDDVENAIYTFVGTDLGVIARAFTPDLYTNLLSVGGETLVELNPSSLGPGEDATQFDNDKTPLSTIVVLSSGISSRITVENGETVPSNIAAGKWILVYDPSDSQYAGVWLVLATTLTTVDIATPGITSVSGGGSGGFRETFAGGGRGGLIGTWCIWRDNGTPGYEQWNRISGYSITEHQSRVWFDKRWIRGVASGGPESTTVLSLESDDAGYVSTGRLYLGQLPCRVRKHLGLGDPQKSKQLTEIWITQVTNGDQQLRFTRELNETPGFLGSQIINSIYRDIAYGYTQGQQFSDNVYFNKTDIPSFKYKGHGVELVDYGTGEFNLYNYVLKFVVN